MAVVSLAEQRRICMLMSNASCFAKLTEVKKYNILISKSLGTLLKETGLLLLTCQMGKQVCKKMRCDLRLLVKATSDENGYGFPDMVSILISIAFPFKELFPPSISETYEY